MKKILLLTASLIALSPAALAGISFPPSANTSFIANATQLPNWNKALAKVLAQKGNARILCLGDSTTQGYYATNAATGDMQSLSFCGQLTNALNAAGIYASNQSVVGNADGTRITTTTPLFTAGPWSSPGVTAGTLGGQYFWNNGTAGTGTFTPKVPVDTFVLRYLTTSGAGTINYNVDGGANTPINENAANSYASVTIPAGSLGYHTLNLVSAAGSNQFWTSVEAYDSSKSQVLVYNAGWSGSGVETTNGNWGMTASAPWDPITACGSFAADLVIINLQINSEHIGTALPTYKTLLQNIITGCQSGGHTDVALMTSSHINPADITLPTSEATQATYAAAIRQVAAAASNSGGTVTGIPVIDEFANLVSYAFQNNTLGAVYLPGSYPQDLHLNYFGYGIMARDIMQIIAPTGNAGGGYVANMSANYIEDNGGKFLVRGGTAPTISSCGTAPAISGSDSSFKLTMGSGALTSCVVNFGSTWATAPKSCQLTAANSTAAATGTTGAYVSAISTTQVTITGLNMTSAIYNVNCF